MKNSIHEKPKFMKRVQKEEVLKKIQNWFEDFYKNK